MLLKYYENGDTKLGRHYINSGLLLQYVYFTEVIKVFLIEIINKIKIKIKMIECCHNISRITKMDTNLEIALTRV